MPRFSHQGLDWFVLSKKSNDKQEAEKRNQTKSNFMTFTDRGYLTLWLESLVATVFIRANSHWNWTLRSLHYMSKKMFFNAMSTTNKLLLLFWVEAEFSEKDISKTGQKYPNYLHCAARKCVFLSFGCTNLLIMGMPVLHSHRVGWQLAHSYDSYHWTTKYSDCQCYLHTEWIVT